MARAQLTLSSKNYSSWSLRGWLLCRMAGLQVDEEMIALDDPKNRAELLAVVAVGAGAAIDARRCQRVGHARDRRISERDVPQGAHVPADRVARAHCRSISGEIHSGFANLRSALPMNLRMRHEKFRIFAGARPDIDRIETIWSECLVRYGGPYLFGAAPTVADAMYAPVTRRFITYAVALSPTSRAYCDTITAWPLMTEWIAEAAAEPAEMEELDVEF